MRLLNFIVYVTTIMLLFMLFGCHNDVANTYNRLRYRFKTSGISSHSVVNVIFTLTGHCVLHTVLEQNKQRKYKQCCHIERPNKEDKGLYISFNLSIIYSYEIDSKQQVSTNNSSNGTYVWCSNQSYFIKSVFIESM